MWRDMTHILKAFIEALNSAKRAYNPAKYA